MFNQETGVTTMKSKIERHYVELIALTDPGEAQTVEVMLMPWGEVKTADGRDFVVDEESGRMIVAAFAEGKKDIPIDFEHTTTGQRITPTGAAPAAGWITSIRAKSGEGIFAMVKWNDSTRAMIKGDEYRYLSPVIGVRKKDRKAVAVESAALTNKPAIVDMERLAAKENELGDETMNFTELKAALTAAGVTLKDDAEGDDILSAAKEFVGVAVRAKAEAPPLMAIAAKLGLPANSSFEVVEARIGDLQVNVPAAEYKTVTDRLAKLEGIARDREGQEVIAYAIETAKINPNHEASMTQYRIMAKTDPIAFRRLVDVMPALYSVGRLIRQSALDDDTSANEEKLLAKEVALHEGDKKKALISLQEKLIDEQMSAGLRKDVAIARCKEVHPMIFGGSR
jgi:phage I-like protein